MSGLDHSLSMALLYNTANTIAHPISLAPALAAPARPNFCPFALRQLWTLDNLPEAILSLICSSLPYKDFNSLLQTSRGLERVCLLRLNLTPKANIISHHIIVNIMPLFTDKEVIDLELQNHLPTPDFLPTQEYPGPKSEFPIEKIIAARKTQVEEISRLPQPAQVQSLHILAAQYWIENKLRNQVGKDYADVEACRTRLALSPNFREKCAIIKEYINKESYGKIGGAGTYVKLEERQGHFNLLVQAIYVSYGRLMHRSLFDNLIKHLLKVEANVNGTPKAEFNPNQGTIAACIMTNRRDLLKLFLEKGAAPDGQTCDSRSPIFILANREFILANTHPRIIKERKSALEVFFQYYPNPFVQNSESLTDILQRYRQSPFYIGTTGLNYNIGGVEDRILLLENYKPKFKAKVEEILKAQVVKNAIVEAATKIILDYLLK